MLADRVRMGVRSKKNGFTVTLEVRGWYYNGYPADAYIEYSINGGSFIQILNEDTLILENVKTIQFAGQGDYIFNATITRASDESILLNTWRYKTTDTFVLDKNELFYYAVSD